MNAVTNKVCSHLLALVPASKVLLLSVALLVPTLSYSQETRTPNGIEDQRPSAYALTNATVYVDGGYQSESTVLMREGYIVEIGESSELGLPDGYFEIDLQGKFIYPGFIDLYTEYGIPEAEQIQRSGAGENLFSENKAFNVNDAVRPQFRASEAFSPDEKTRELYRKAGFSSVLSARLDGIARGTSALITLGDENANESIVLPDAAAHYSLSKGSSTQSMPSSLMGAIALLRQTYLDAQWFKQQQPRPFTDESLEAFNRNQSLPQIMESNNWQQALSLDKVGDEFDTQYLFKTQGDSYKRTDLIKATNATLIVPVNFPEPPDVSDAFESDSVSLVELKHWGLAPYNLAKLSDAQIPFVITSHGAQDSFWNQLRMAVENGLPENEAIAAISSTPAQILGLDNLGQLVPGAHANLVVSSDNIFNQDSRLLQNWIRGKQYVLEQALDEREGNYRLAIGQTSLDLAITISDGKPRASEITEADEKKNLSIDLSDGLISLSYNDEAGTVRLNGWPTDSGWQGSGQLANGSWQEWQLSKLTTDASQENAPSDSDDELEKEAPATLTYPFQAYGRTTIPTAQDFVVRNALVWTLEEQGNVVTDVLVRDGKIAAIQDGVNADNAIEIDGDGRHLTPGIIDEHSHIALFNINEGATNSSMVRMKDVVNAEDVNIYRNLAGGVTAAQLLHGSANPIGGQSALIKMRWGKPAPELLIEDADEFIKFALGENVKRSRSPGSIRYPQTRMGVEQVFVNAFSQAREYGKAWDAYNNLSRNQRRNTPAPRRDLVDEAILEILRGERYVTSHSYVQSEINMLMHVADNFDFNINTFTHILEGYKVADKMAAHGAGGSTFSDWWGYKWEAFNAIPYNAALMHQAGVVTAINSDDAEMSRRLNQEAAKSIKYGGLSEIDALKLVTLNPAKLLHLEDRMGSIAVGKDADLVLWSDHPLSIYAIAEKTWVDGVGYYDRQEDMQLREQIAEERARLIAAISGSSDQPNSPAPTESSRSNAITIHAVNLIHTHEGEQE